MEKYILAALAMLALTSTHLFLNENQIQEDPYFEIYQKFIIWMSENNKNYNGPEVQLRFSIFSENYEYIKEWNTYNKEMILGLTNFADLTNEEYRERYLTLQRPVQQEEVEVNDLIVPPSKDDKSVVNWVEKGAVAPVQNQGNCGGCWAFSTTGSLTGLNYIKNGNLEVFSSQQLISCDHVDHGCNGGHYNNAFIYTKNNGISLESDYPYEQVDNPQTEKCQEDLINPVFKNSGYTKVQSEDVQGMLDGLKKQPLSIAVGANSLAFQLYRKGTIIHRGCSTNLDHAILLVGVNLSSLEEKEKYWLVKNSWGPQWGDEGYAKIQYMEGGKGVCGINLDSSYPN